MLSSSFVVVLVIVVARNLSSLFLLPTYLVVLVLCLLLLCLVRVTQKSQRNTSRDNNFFLYQKMQTEEIPSSQKEKIQLWSLDGEKSMQGLSTQAFFFFLQFSYFRITRNLLSIFSHFEIIPNAPITTGYKRTVGTGNFTYWLQYRSLFYQSFQHYLFICFGR